MIRSTDRAGEVHETEERVPEGEVVIGECTGLDSNGSPLVTFYLGAKKGPVAATATCEITPAAIGRQVALLFVGGNVGNPIIVGFLHNPLYQLLNQTRDVEVFPEQMPRETRPTASVSTPDQVVFVDGHKTVVEGEQEIVLRCGDASITLTKAGKIILRGKYLMSRSTGVNRILGGSVQIN